MGLDTVSRYSVASDDGFHVPPVPPCASSSAAFACARARASPLVEPVVSRERRRPSWSLIFHWMRYLPLARRTGVTESIVLVPEAI